MIVSFPFLDPLSTNPACPWGLFLFWLLTVGQEADDIKVAESDYHRHQRQHFSTIHNELRQIVKRALWHFLREDLCDYFCWQNFFNTSVQVEIWCCNYGSMLSFSGSKLILKSPKMDRLIDAQLTTAVSSYQYQCQDIGSRVWEGGVTPRVSELVSTLAEFSQSGIAISTSIWWWLLW